MNTLKDALRDLVEEVIEKDAEILISSKKLTAVEQEEWIKEKIDEYLYRIRCEMSAYLEH